MRRAPPATGPACGPQHDRSSTAPARRAALTGLAAGPAPPAAGRHGHGTPSQTRRFRSLRAAQYHAQALFYVLGTDHPGDEEAVCLAGRGAWDTFAGLCSPAAVRTKVPYGTTHLPVWFFRPDGPAEPRPTVILTNGSDGQNFDVFHPGRPQQMDDLLRTRRAYVNMTEATGAQLHCSPMAPQQHCDVVFDWLADVLQR